ncbi:MAG: 6,7-dimethyl-8-ribityllumazine synthase, partial [Planctomycetota bacterium]
MPAHTRTAEPTPPASPAIALVVSQYNRHITEALERGAIEAIERLAPDAEVTVVPVPGAWELIAGASAAAETGAHAVVCLGCVIKGETEHDLFINQAVSNTLGALSAELPVGFGLLTVSNAEQAEARAGGAMGNKGAEAVEAVLATLGVIDALFTLADA